MKYSNVYIDALTYELPDEAVTSRSLEERLAPMYRKLHIPVGQLEAMTGIVERRFWKPRVRVSKPATQAAIRAFKRSNVPSEAVGALFYSGVCRQEHEPATACHVAAHLAEAGYPIAPNAEIFDISNACLGAMTAMTEVANRIQLGWIRAGLVVSCESAREIVETMLQRMVQEQNIATFKYSIATMTGGSAAIAILLTDGSFTDEHKPRLLGGATRNAPQHHNLCRWGTEPDPKHFDPSNPHAHLRPYMKTDPVAVLDHGVKLGADTWADFLKRLEWTNDDVDRVIMHQVGSKHRDSILKVLGLPPECDFAAFSHFGNTGSCAVPLAAAIAWEDGFLKPGDHVGFLGIGSGLNCTMLALSW